MDMSIEQQTLTFMTKGRGATNITTEIAAVVAKAHVHRGLCHLFLQHTSASLYGLQCTITINNPI